MSRNIPIVVAFGDGIGPEIMNSVLYILKEARAPLQISSIEVGEKLYLKNFTSGIEPSSWNLIANSKAMLKAPITTPQGKGYKSLNVTLRKTLGLYSNIRPVTALHPFVKTLHPDIDIVIFRENEEDLYTGIEYRQTSNQFLSLKQITKTGSEKIIRHAFDYADRYKRKKVSCLSKDNIMKMTDGAFHSMFEVVAKEYPDIISEHYIVDIGTARIATQPNNFDVIVTSNLYGDIISDVAAEVSGSIGLAGSANIGENYAMFEAVHGSAPDIAGKGLANPSGLLNAALMMLRYLKEERLACLIENAWKRTIEDGIHTSDIFNLDHSVKKVSTEEFAQHIVDNIGKDPNSLEKAIYASRSNSISQNKEVVINVSKDKVLKGVDIYISRNNTDVEHLAGIIKGMQLDNLQLQNISAKGLKLWPSEHLLHIQSDQFCCRFISQKSCTHKDIVFLLEELYKNSIDFVQINNLIDFDSVPGYSLLQGE